MELPTTPREAARVYAHSLGWAVLAIWPPKDGHCTCPNPTCQSPGKHPHPYSGGVHGATTDLDEIESWPPDINIAVALGQASSGLMVLDIDQPEVTERLQKWGGLENRTAVSRTARGEHVYFISPSETRGFNLTDEEGLHLGEVRGDGQYVILPPSIHPTGIRYEWLSLDQLEQTDG